MLGDFQQFEDMTRILPQGAREAAMAQMAILSSLIRARIDKGFTDFILAAEYARELRRLWNSLWASAQDYGAVLRRIQEGDKRTKPVQLVKILDRLIFPVSAIDLSDPVYHPIDYSLAPGDGAIVRVDHRNHKYTHEHVDQGLRLRLYWDWHCLEPDYWLAERENGQHGLSHRTIAEAVQKCLEVEEYFRLQQKEYRETRYTMEELLAMFPAQIRAIAGERNIEGHRKKRLATIRNAIIEANPREDTGAEYEKTDS